MHVSIYRSHSSLTLKPQSHRIVRLRDRTIGCDLANVRPIGNVCYEAVAYCGRSFLLVVGHRTIGRTRGRAINTDWRRSMTRSIISKEIVRLMVAINDRSYDQSWPPDDRSYDQSWNSA